MFTGLIQGLGHIKSLDLDLFTLSLSNAAMPLILPDLAIGDSVAVDGVCLTVEEILPQGFRATTSPETLQRTTLGQRYKTTEWVNLETSLRVGSKLGGHFVTGHVDGIGCLAESISTEKAWEMTFKAPSSPSEPWQRYVAPYLVQKGSIAVNGISLTIADCAPDDTWFKVAVIPHTYQETNLCYLQSGDLVNIEVDILGKYVNKFLGHRLRGESQDQDITMAFLSEHGY